MGLALKVAAFAFAAALRVGLQYLGRTTDIPERSHRGWQFPARTTDDSIVVSYKGKVVHPVIGRVMITPVGRMRGLWYGEWGFGPKGSEWIDGPLATTEVLPKVSSSDLARG